MSIRYIEQLNNELNNLNEEKKTKKNYALASIEDIELDKQNPRFASSTQLDDNSEIDEKAIIKYLVQYGKLLEIMNSIIHNKGLYWEEWLSCYITKENKLVVLEGNRRISACKALLNMDLLPEDKRTEINLPADPTELYSNISTIRVVVYTDSEDAQNYITAKHTNPEIKKWETFEQCNYYYSQFAKGIPIETMANRANDKIANVIKDIKRYNLFTNVFSVTKKQHSDLLIEGTSILPLVDKFMPTLISNDKPYGLNLTYNETLLTYSPAPERADIYNKILYKLGEAFFVRPSLKGNDTNKRDNSNEFRISTDEIKSKKKVVQMIKQDIRIPGLKDLISAYNELSTDTTKQDDEPTSNAATSSTQTDDSTAKTESATTNENTKNSNQSKNQKEYEFFENLDFSTLNPQNEDDLGLYRVCDEIVKISQYNNAGYKRFPIAATFLLRSLIEQTLIRQLKKVNEYDKLCKKNNNKTPELGKICELFLRQYQAGNYKLFSNDEALARLYNQTFSGFGTKDQLDTVVHRPHTIQPDTNFLNALSKQGIKEIIQTIISNIYVIEEADN